MSADERDEFWDIEKLIPRRKKRAGISFDVSGTEISETPHDGENDTREQNKLSFENRGVQFTEKTVCEYTPDNVFIKKVRVCSRKSAYRYYEDFEQTMHKYLRLTVKEAERVPFFSYVPQYSQLSSARLSWYLYWRSGCRRREYVPTDYSYVLLYIFELLNFDNPKYPERIIDELCSLWRAYRRDYPQLDRCMPDWACDYCLIHRVGLPYETLSDFMDEFLPFVSLREFFLGNRGEGEQVYARAVVAGASGYNYRKSKYYTPENKAAFDTHILSAASTALEVSSQKLKEVCREENCSSARRDAYAGALCTSSAKRVLYIEYLPLYRSGELRAEATLAVKYAENRLRAVLGVRSRLSTAGLSAEIKNSIDAYFAEHFKERFERVKKGERAADAVPGYMAYYDSPGGGLEPGRAASIEAESWETAALMSESFDGDEDADAALDEDTRASAQRTLQELSYDVNETPSVFDVTAPCGGGYGDGGFEVLFSEIDELSLRVLALLADKQPAAAAKEALSGGSFISDICERINASALDAVGDILIECDSGEYYILTDYESEVRKWLRI